MMEMLRATKYWSFSLAIFLVFLASDAVFGQQGPPESNPNATFEQLSAQAASAREAGRVDDAIRFYQRALQLQPDWAEGWWYVGTLNYDADHYAEAIPALQSLVALSPQMGPALAFLGLSEFETKDYNKSLSHLQQAHQQGYGDDAELEKVATYHLALLYNWSGEFDKTVDVLRPGIQRGRPPDEIKVALGMALLQIPLFASEVDPGKDALIHAAGEAAALLDAGNFVAAADALQQLVAEYPKTPYLHYAHADALASAGKSEEALRELVEEAKISPRSALPYVRMASLNLELHHANEALPSARKAVLLAPRSSASHEVLARTLKDLGEAQEAEKERAAAKKLESNAAEVDLGQRELYARNQVGGNTSPQPAIAVAGSEDSFEALAQKAAAAQAAGQMDATIPYYQRALALHPEWEEGWRNLGTSYYASTRYADAVTALKNAAAINGRNGNVWALLGLSEFETKDYKNSLIHLERGRDLGFAGNAAAVQVARYHLAILLNRNGDFDNATELLTPESGSGPLEEQVKVALGIALLRIPLFPDELDHANDSLVSQAGETAALLSESKYDQAFSKFEQLLKTNSRTPYLHYAYGSALASASRYGEAEEQLAEETKITPSSALPYLRRSTIALQLRNADSAMQLAQQAVQLAPKSAEGHYLLGRSWLELGKTADSVKELEAARGLAPNSPEVRFSLARAYAKAGQPDAAEQERASFERLNALVQSQRSRSGSQAYGAIQNQNGIRAAEGDKSAQTQPASHPD
ncbi:MAG TPA: tetratricopeptide repeat protein [Terriglobales bacterium]